MNFEQIPRRGRRMMVLYCTSATVAWIWFGWVCKQGKSHVSRIDFQVASSRAINRQANTNFQTAGNRILPRLELRQQVKQVTQGYPGALEVRKSLK